jgi:hypothetical protein
VPAVSSSPIAALSRQLAPLGEVTPQARGGLLEVLESVPDPRKRRGVRHRFSGILFVSVCAVVSGARSFAAIAEWAADAVEGTLRGMGIGAPNASTVRRALSALSGDGFDTAIGAWLSGRVKAARVGASDKRRRRAIAVDGKALRGSRDGEQRARMVMACLDHDSGVTVGQVEIGEKSNEIPMFTTLLDTIADLTGLVVTADALHAQREHAEYLHRRGAHYVITVKGNQKGATESVGRSAMERRANRTPRDRHRPRPHGDPHLQGRHHPRRDHLPARRPCHPDRPDPQTQ